MTDIKLPQHTPEEVRICICYEYCSGKPVFEAYRSMCDTLGKDVISYVDFEFWFYRFKQGYADMNYDRSNDPVYRDIGKMPLKVIDTIVNFLEIKEQFYLRKVCHDFRNFIDRREDRHKTLSFELTDNGACLEFANRKMIFTEDGVVKLQFSDGQQLVGDVEEETHLTLSPHDLTSILMMEGLRLDLLEIKIKMDWTSVKAKIENKVKTINTFYDALKSATSIITRKVRVKSLKMRVDKESHVATVLSLLEPGFLEEVEIEYWIDRPADTNDRGKEIVQPISDIGLDVISEMEQWKKAKVMLIKRLKLPRGISHLFYHFNRFEAIFSRIDKTMFQSLERALLENPDFQSCHLTSRNKISFFVKSAVLKVTRRDKSIVMEANPEI